MNSRKISSLFLILLLVSSVIILGNSQTALALTPVADLTGEWSGFAHVSFTGTYCETSGKVNGSFKQNGNKITGTYSFVPTTPGPNPDAASCSYDPWTVQVDGTIDGSRITLFAEDITFSGWYASSGIKLDAKAEWLDGTVQLSPTNFTPPPYQPKDGGEEAKKKAAEEKKKKAAEEAKKKKDADDAKKKAEEAKKKAAEEKKKKAAEETKKKSANDAAKKKSDEPKKTEEKKDPTETKQKNIEPPTPSVFEINEKTKPFFKALWDAKCDVLSHQWELLTTKSGRLPIVCSDGNIALPSGEIVQFSIGDNVGVELVKWGVNGLFAKYMYVGLAKDVRDFIRVSRDVAKITDDVTGVKSAYERIESVKAINLFISKGEGELLGGVIKFKINCPTGECKFMKMEEDGGGFKFYDIFSTFDPKTKMLEATFNHNSVYLLVEYTPEKTQEKKSNQSTSTTSKATKYLSYENKQYGFSIKYPSDWKKTVLLKNDETFPGLLNIVNFGNAAGDATTNVGFIKDDANKGISQKILNMMKNEVKDQFESDFCSAASAEVTCLVEVYEDSTVSEKKYAVSVVALLATMSSAETSFTLPAVLVGVIPNGNDAWLITASNLSVENTDQNSEQLNEISGSFTISNYKGAQKTKRTGAVVESSAGTLTLNSNEFTVSKYSPAEAIVSGHVNSYQKGTLLTLTIVKPDKSSMGQGIAVTKDGNFRAPIKIDSNWAAGNYQILAKYGPNDLGSVSFIVKNGS